MAVGGKSNIVSAIMSSDELFLIIADGAAFGPEMERVTELMKIRASIWLYLPASFEWMILQSGLIEKEHLTDILFEPASYINSEKYFSWEQFFTDVLQESANGTIYQ